MRRGRIIIPRDDVSSEIVPANEIVFDTNRNGVIIGNGINAGKDLSSLSPSVASSTATTANATPTNIQTIDLPDNSIGSIELTILATTPSGANSLTGKKIFQYQKVSGVLAFNSSTPVSDFGLWTGTAPTWTGQSSSNVFFVQATGVAATTINWKVFYRVDVLPL